jgi:copper resistance protein B
MLLVAGRCGAQESMPDMDMDMDMMMSEMGEQIFSHVLLDQFEGRLGGADSAFRWDAQGWIGGDYDKLWIKSEGTVQGNGTVGDGDHELLYDRAISTYFDLQAGLRSDLESRTTRNWAAFGVQGLAPLFFDVEATGYVSDQGHLAARFQASYDLPLTQRLILQPEIELNLYSRSDPGRAIGSGLSDIDTGLRLRYEVTRKFAPYVGVVYQGSFGQTAGLMRRAGETTGDVRVTIGIRSWF